MLAGCGQKNDGRDDLTPDQQAARQAETDKAIANIQASKGSPEQKEQAISGLRGQPQSKP